MSQYQQHSGNFTSREGNLKKDEGFADGSSGGAGTYGSGAGAGATDPGNTGLGGYNPSNAQTQDDDDVVGKGGSNTAPATSDLNEFNAQMDAEFNKGERERERERQRQPNQPTTGERLRGTAEQWAGQVTGDTDLQARGEERRVRLFIFNMTHLKCFLTMFFFCSSDRR